MIDKVIEGSRTFMQLSERSTTLYSFSAEYVELLDLLDSAEDPATEQSLGELLDQVEGKIDRKAESIAGLVRELEFRARARDDEARRLSENADRDKRAVEWLRGYLLEHMLRTGKTRIETVRFTLNVRQNQPHVEIMDIDELPEEYKRTIMRVDPDKVKIQEHYRATGEIVPGTDMVRKSRLDIR